MTSWGHYEVHCSPLPEKIKDFNFNLKKINIQFGDKMNTENLEKTNSKYEVQIFSNDKNNNRMKSKVTIACDDYKTFSKIVEAVNPILEEECK